MSRNPQKVGNLLYYFSWEGKWIKYSSSTKSKEGTSGINKRREAKRTKKDS